MKKERKTHSREFKQEAVALVVEQRYSFADAGRSLGVSGALIVIGLKSVALSLVLTLGIAAISWTFIEKPALRLKRYPLLGK